MSTTTVAKATSQDKRVMEIARNLFAQELKTHAKLTPDQVVFIVEDICIEAGRPRAALPSVLVATYENAKRRVRAGDGAKLEYLTQNLVRDMERALAKM